MNVRDGGPTIISSDGAPRAIGPYSQAVVIDGWVYCSGQIGLDPNSMELVAGGVVEQTRQAVSNMRAVLEAASCSFKDVVKATLYLADMADFKAVNEIWAEVFPQHPPARSTVQAAALPRGARFEFDVVARQPSHTP